MRVNRSFSGTHEYRPDCVQAIAELTAVTDFGWTNPDRIARSGRHWAETVTGFVESGRCPRCKGAMPIDYPGAGSRLTTCRCIPICSACGADEAWYPMPIWRWPTSRSAMSRRRNKVYANSSVKAGILSSSGDSLTVITEDGSTPVKLRPHPGGWAEFGMDD